MGAYASRALLLPLAVYAAVWWRQAQCDITIRFGPELRCKKVRSLPSGTSRLVQLSQGSTWCCIDGDDNPGRLVVLVHGFSGSSGYFEFLAECLARSNGRRRVLRFDLYGRGGSSCTGAPHTPRLFAGQLAELLFALKEHGPIDLVGYSMGGAIAAQFAAAYPDTVASLALLAPGGAPSMRKSIPAVLPLAVRIGPIRWALGIYLNRAIGRSILHEWGHPTSARALAENARERQRRLDEPALARSLSLTLAYFPFTGMSDVFHEAGKSRRPTLLVSQQCSLHRTLVCGLPRVVEFGANHARRYARWTVHVVTDPLRHPLHVVRAHAAAPCRSGGRATRPARRADVLRRSTRARAHACTHA
jgi:pimeloyl-ACP methyl ester carboxylesterase